MDLLIMNKKRKMSCPYCGIEDIIRTNNDWDIKAVT